MSARALFDELRAALRQRVPGTLGALPPGVLQASVLVPFFEKQNEAHLLFLKRPEGSYRHAGQIAFPGGRREAGETALACALREAQEEVGLSPADVEILGPLDEFDTVVSGFRVTPFVGIIPFPYPLRPDPREVERLIEKPLRSLLDPGVFHTEPREALGLRRLVHFYDVGPDLIWGVTAGMLTPLLELIRTLPSCPRA
jgi:8-oxo-dGTP pyrophosphatase MutT (NUDIX family)